MFEGKKFILVMKDDRHVTYRTCILHVPVTSILFYTLHFVDETKYKTNINFPKTSLMYFSNQTMQLQKLFPSVMFCNEMSFLMNILTVFHSSKSEVENISISQFYFMTTLYISPFLLINKHVWWINVNFWPDRTNVPVMVAGCPKVNFCP